MTVERPYGAGRGKMYRQENALGQLREVMQAYKREQYPDE